MRNVHHIRIRPTTLLILVTALAILAGPTNLLAHGGAKGIVKERMEAMKSIGKAMKSLGKMARGKVPLDTRKVEQAAGEIAAHGLRIPALFPMGSGHGVTEASPSIWQDPEGFKKSANDLVTSARALMRAAQSKNASAIKTNFRLLGKTCGSCHKLFRIKKRDMKHRR